MTSAASQDELKACFFHLAALETLVLVVELGAEQLCSKLGGESTYLENFDTYSPYLSLDNRFSISHDVLILSRCVTLSVMRSFFHAFLINFHVLCLLSLLR